MYTNAKIRIYPVGIYLLKVKNENSRTRCVICSNSTKKKTSERHWHKDIKKHWHRCGVSIVNFEKIPFLSISFLNFGKWVLLAGFTSTDQGTDKEKLWHYAILTKRVMLEHEKKPVLNLISMQSVGFEQT